jgi:hypothetical protein
MPSGSGVLGLQYHFISKGIWNGTPYDDSTSTKFDFSYSVDYGANKKDFRRLISLGLDCTTVAVGVKLDKFYVKPAYMSAEGPGFSGTTRTVYIEHMAYWNANADKNFSYSAATYNVAITRFVAKCRKEQHRFQGGVFFGEIRQTINLLRRPIQAFRELSLSYHSKAKKLSRMKDKSKMQEKLADLWLTYSFGIKPLIADIDDAMYDLSYLTVGRPVTAHIKVRQQDKSIENPSTTINSYITYWRPTTIAYHRVTNTVDMSGAVVVAWPETEDFNGSRALNEAISDFLPTIYNLIPYSFLVDYFSNIGDIVSAYSFNRAAVNWTSHTKRVEVTKQLYVQYEYVPDRYGSSYLPTKATQPSASETITTTKKFVRAPIAQWIPSLEFNLLGWPKDWKKLANIGALLLSVKSVR